MKHQHLLEGVEVARGLVADHPDVELAGIEVHTGITSPVEVSVHCRHLHDLVQLALAENIQVHARPHVAGQISSCGWTEGSVTVCAWWIKRAIVDDGEYLDADLVEHGMDYADEVAL